MRFRIWLTFAVWIAAFSESGASRVPGEGDYLDRRGASGRGGRSGRTAVCEQALRIAESKCHHRKSGRCSRHPLLLPSRRGRRRMAIPCFSHRSRPHCTAPVVYKNITYDPSKDFSHIGLIATAPAMLSVNSALPIHSVADLVAYARSKPGELNFGSSGNGSGPQLWGEMFMAASGVS